MRPNRIDWLLGFLMKTRPCGCTPSIACDMHRPVTEEERRRHCEKIARVVMDGVDISEFVKDVKIGHDPGKDDGTFIAGLPRGPISFNVKLSSLIRKETMDAYAESIEALAKLSRGGWCDVFQDAMRRRTDHAFLFGYEPGDVFQGAEKAKSRGEETERLRRAFEAVDMVVHDEWSRTVRRGRRER